MHKSTKNIDCLRQKICNQITEFTYEEMYELLTGDNPFQTSLCKLCAAIFGSCPEDNKDDELCKERFKKWCEM